MTAPRRPSSDGASDRAPAPDRAAEELADAIARKGARHARARRERRHGLGFGLGLFGLIGWSVAVPTVVGIALGVWIDARSEGTYSWTLMLMLAGLAVGCLNAWYWLRKEGGFGDDDGPA